MTPDHDEFWDELLTYVEAHSVIPVVGPELVIVDHDGRREPYFRTLARELATRLKLGDPGGAATLDQVVGAYLAKPGSRRQSVYRELGDIAQKLQVNLPEPLLQLAGITDLNLYVSFCTDNLLAQAINAARFGGRAETRELSFNPSEAGDLPDGSRDVPLVYGLFGRISVLPKYVVAEEDELEWVTALQIPEKRPERLFDELGRNHLLFLGCRFPDWLARFILRTAKNSKLSAERGFSEYLIDADAKSDSPLVAFLTSFSRETQVLALDPVDFVAELAQRWQQRARRRRRGQGAGTRSDAGNHAARQPVHQLCQRGPPGRAAARGGTAGRRTAGLARPPTTRLGQRLHRPHSPRDPAMRPVCARAVAYRGTSHRILSQGMVLGHASATSILPAAASPSCARW